MSVAVFESVGLAQECCRFWRGRRKSFYLVICFLDLCFAGGFVDSEDLFVNMSVLLRQVWIILVATVEILFLARHFRWREQPPSLNAQVYLANVFLKKLRIQGVSVRER